MCRQYTEEVCLIVVAQLTTERRVKWPKQKFERNKPHCNIGTIGQSTTADVADGGDHPRCWRNPAVRRSPRTTRSTKAPEEKARGITISTAHVEYETKTGITPTSTAPATPTM